MAEKTKPNGLQSKERGDGGDDGRDIGGASVCNDKVVLSGASQDGADTPTPAAALGLSHCRSARCRLPNEGKKVPSRCLWLESKRDGASDGGAGGVAGQV